MRQFIRDLPPGFWLLVAILCFLRALWLILELVQRNH